MNVIFLGLMIVAFIVIALIYALFERLKTKHPQKYSSMGEPKIYYRSSIRVMLKFLFKREYRGLNDGTLALMSKAIAGGLVLYVLLFIGLYLK